MRPTAGTYVLGLGMLVTLALVFVRSFLSEAAGADQIVLLAGRVVASGPPAAVLTEEHLVEAYRGRFVDVAGLRLIDDPHHHGARSDRHDGHEH